MSEHASGSYVTWRDLETLGVVRQREIDLRLREMERALTLAKSAADEANHVAREGVLKHDEDKNNLLEQMANERAHYATKDELSRQLEAVALEFHGLLEKEVASLRGDTSRLGVTVSTSGQSISNLQQSSSKREGRELGLWGAAIAAVAVALSLIGNAVLKLVFS